MIFLPVVSYEPLTTPLPPNTCELPLTNPAGNCEEPLITPLVAFTIPLKDVPVITPALKGANVNPVPDVSTVAVVSVCNPLNTFQLCPSLASIKIPACL